MIVPMNTEYAIEAASNAARWQKADIPARGDENGWLLADGSDITCLGMDSSGVLYAGVVGLSSNLYKSTDNGNNWQAVGRGTDNIIDMVITPDNAVYYATSHDIYRFSGGTDILVASLPTHLAAPDVVITSIDVSYYNGSYAILTGAENQNSGQFGGAYILSGKVFMQWQDLGLVGCDVYSVAFSPHFEEDGFVVALATDEIDTFITWKGGSSGWGGTIGDARLTDGSTGGSIVAAGAADIAFPDDYCSDVWSGSCVLYAAVATGTDSGDVYAVYGRALPDASIAEDLNTAACCGKDSIDIAGFDICGSIGDINMIAGASTSGDVYISSDSGESWRRNAKPPTGMGNTLVLMSTDYNDSGRVYCGTAGSESAFSSSLDRGMNWNQARLIDTTIDAIIDVAVSPHYGNDRTIFLLTRGNEYSVWHSTDGCDNWERVFCSAGSPLTLIIDKIGISPQYGSESQVLYIYGSSDGNPALWKTTDGGQSFSVRDAPFEVSEWKVVGDASFYIAGSDGNNTLLYKTTSSGVRYETKTTIDGPFLTSIAISPCYVDDKTILIGDDSGGVYLSTDAGVTFTPLGKIASPLIVNISVAFDSGFGLNNTVYAASDMPGSGVYSFTIGESTAWESIDTTLPLEAVIGELGVSESGVLYAINFQQVDVAGVKGGIERCLAPSSSPSFETFTSGLDAGATLEELRISQNTIWSIDTSNNYLLYFTDSLSQKVGLTSPEDGSIVKGIASGSGIKNVLIDWEVLEGAAGYHWQLSNDDNFSSSSIIAEDITSSSSVKLSLLENGSVYYWRVRAVKPVLSPWSDIWSFTSSPLVALEAPQLQSPAAGAVDVPVNTMFQWTAVSGAESYELEVSLQYDFSSMVIRLAGDASLPVNAWQNQGSFGYNTTYYWRVRAVNSDMVGSWSGAGVFSTGQDAAVQTTVSTSSATLPAQTTQTITSFSTVEKLATTVSTELSTVTIVQTQGAPPVSQGVLTVPDWLYYALGFLALMVVMLLTVILVIITKRR